ncbi:MAG TPA: 50S ribosomal protein L17 [Chitinophagaceae bacterium]|nr:50S ribosomal protein L17 [Chitinophagaceae bacterium]
MRHGVKLNRLGRKSAHRKALLSNLACELISHKRIFTTLAKARSLRVYIEPLLTRSKKDTTHDRRIIFGYLQDKQAVKELFETVSGRIATRPGGYTRIIKMGTRLGDNAETALIELVDFNELYTKTEKTKETGKHTRRSSGTGRKKTEKIPAATAVPAATAQSAAPASAETEEKKEA